MSMIGPNNHNGKEKKKRGKGFWRRGKKRSGKIEMSDIIPEPKVIKLFQCVNYISAVHASVYDSH